MKRVAALVLALAVSAAVALAALALFGRSLREVVPEVLRRPAAGTLEGLRHLHSGHIGDYIAWWTAGTALLGGASLVLLK